MASLFCGVCMGDSTSRPGCFNPGCCGTWYHVECFGTIVSCGGTKCPTCQTAFPVALLGANTPPPPPVHVIAEPVFAHAVGTQLPIVTPYAPPQQYLQNSVPPKIFGRNIDPYHEIMMPASDNEDPVAQWVPPTREPSQVAASINIQCVPELPEVSSDGQSSFHAVVSLFSTESSTGQAARTESSRPPMDLVCVLDTSGSMGSDNKLVNLKHAVEYIRSEMGDNDRLSIITFETSAVRQHHLKRMTPELKAQSASITDRICPGGGTRILTGLQTAHQVLSSRQSSNPITSVFLLTDGIDSSDMRQKKETARLLKEMGSSLFVFGFGNDHDSAHLRTIAAAADGMFTYVEKSDMVIDAFGGALGAEQSIFANNLCLTIRSAAGSGTVITNVESGSYRKEVARDGSSVNIFFKNLMLGEERDVLLTLALPPGPDCEHMDILTTEVSYVPLGVDVNCVEGRLSVAGMGCVVSRVPSAKLDPTLARNEKVDVEINRMVLTRATEQAMAAADSADFARARQHIQSAMEQVTSSHSMALGNAKSAAFGAELEATLQNVESRDQYTSFGGRAIMSEQAQNYSAQRCCYQKSSRAPNMYQNDASNVSQFKANISKSKR